MNRTDNYSHTKRLGFPSSFRVYVANEELFRKRKMNGNASSFGGTARFRWCIQILWCGHFPHQNMDYECSRVDESPNAFEPCPATRTRPAVFEPPTIYLSSTASFLPSFLPVQLTVPLGTAPMVLYSSRPSHINIYNAKKIIRLLYMHVSIFQLIYRQSLDSLTRRRRATHSLSETQKIYWLAQTPTQLLFIGFHGSRTELRLKPRNTLLV